MAGMVVFDSRRREAMTRRMVVTGVSSYSAPSGGAEVGPFVGLGAFAGVGTFAKGTSAACLESVAGAGETALGGFAAAWRASDLVIMPLGPVPTMAEGLIPAAARII